MDIRYQHKQVAALWGKRWTYEAWWRVEHAVLTAQRSIGWIEEESTRAFVTMPEEDMPRFDERAVADIDRIERQTKHDVAAFVQYMREWWGEPHARWIHFGLTSSDVVDTAQGMRFKALRPTLEAMVRELCDRVSEWERKDRVVLGRTHGQPAEPTNIAVRAAHWSELIDQTSVELLRATRAMQVAKIAGPVGTYAHNPPAVEQMVAELLGLDPQAHGASQITPRSSLARWANAAAGLVQAISKVATDMRLMNLLGELREPQSTGQVGSSAMPHKNNMIRAEQINGLARLALGYAVSLQPLDLWLERDISNSSVERIVVPDLWHLLLHVIEQACVLLERAELVPVGIMRSFQTAAGVEMTARMTNGLIASGEYTAEGARQFANEQARLHPLDARVEVQRPEDTEWFMRNYPWLAKGDAETEVIRLGHAGSDRWTGGDRKDER